MQRVPVWGDSVAGPPLHRAGSGSGELGLKKIGTSHLGKQSRYNFKDNDKTYLWGVTTFVGCLLCAKP